MVDMAEPLKIPAQYASYGQPHLLKPYQPYAARQQTPAVQSRLNFATTAEERRGRGGVHGTTPRSANRRLSAGKRTKQVPGGSKSSSGGGSQPPSSTPHAPRKKRSVLELIPHGISNVLPSTHDLLRKHTFIDSGHLKSEEKVTCVTVVRGEEREVRGKVEAGKPVSREGERGREVRVREEGERARKAVRRQAWQDDRQGGKDKEPEKQPVKVRPYRRTVTVAPPDGIPLLDLTKLNEPDHTMQPVELMCVEGDGSDTARSGLSWGVPFSKSPEPTKDHEKEEPAAEEVVVEVTERGGTEGSAVGDNVEVEEEESENRQTGMDITHAKFVEEKILSHERAISSLSPHPHIITSPPSPHHTSTTKPPPGQRVGVAIQSHLTFGTGMAETDLTRRLQFEARVLTQNGRDIHRDLCGFFFLADGSITVYEFRQFGKKSSALPLVQRKVYCHQLGHRKGEPYQINFIRKGATLQFPTSLLPSLPDYMTSRPLLSLRITQCSERDKRQLLCANRKPMECVSITAYLKQPLSPPQQQAWSELSKLQGNIRLQLIGRARKTLVGLERHFSKLTSSSSSSSSSPSSPSSLSLTVERDGLKSALQMYHIFVSDRDFHHLWLLLTTVGGFATADGGAVWSDRCIAGIVGEMNEERKAMVRKVFQKLDTTKSGLVSLTNIRRFYRQDCRDIEEVWFDHTHRTPQHSPMTTITYTDFENYYEGVSIETSKDGEFITELRTCWTI